MAARKSCTHLTWGEAKARSGQLSGQKKNKEALRKQDHGAVLAAKIIKKQGGSYNENANKKLAKQYRKQEEKAAAIAAQRLEEREQKRLAALEEVRPYDRVKEQTLEKLKEISDQDSIAKVDTAEVDLGDEEIKAKIVECKQMQLDEILALEAMIPEEDFALCSSSRTDELREKLERYEAADGGDETARSSIVSHPPISFIIRLEVDDNTDLTGDPDVNLNVNLLLQVTLPPLYLNSDGSQKPYWNFQYVMVTDKNAFCSADKPLESLAWLDEKNVTKGMDEHAEEGLLPYPCVYELAVTWLSDHIFEFLTVQPHILATK